MKKNRIDFIRMPVKITILISIVFIHLSGSGLVAEPEIDVLLSSNTSIYITTLHNLQSTIRAKLRLHFFDTLSDNDKLDYFSAIERKNEPFILTLGFPATKSAMENLTKTKIVFSLVSSPKTLLSGEEKNSCGVNTDVPISEFFHTVKDLKPSVKKIFAFYSSPQGEHTAKEGYYQDSYFGIDYNAIAITDKNEFRNALSNLKGRADAFYLVPDPLFTQENFDYLSKFCQENNIILMTPVPVLAKVGATFSITPFYARVGMLLGELSNEIISGKQCSQTIIPSREYSLFINREYSEKSGLKIPDHIRRRADSSKILIEAISFFEKENYEISRILLRKILEEDSGNKTAILYRDLINNKLSGDKIRKFLIEGKNFLIEKNFQKARESYRRALDLNPDIEEAKAGFRDASFAESEEKRKMANTREQNGDSFSALNLYSEALRLSDGNEKARAELTNLRRKEMKNIPGYREEGSIEYGKRNYGKAEEIFKNILLIDAQDKYAKEYVVLSNTKKLAMEKFLFCIRTKDRNCSLLWKK
ncbi:MAG: hypothetical protein K8R21_13115 [Leptospira sp.]|nr:hypothetical protein [Leptospira sp.]